MKKLMMILGLAVVATFAIAAVGPGLFDSGTVALTDVDNYQQICSVQADGKPIVADVQIGSAGAIGHFLVAQSAQLDATTRPLAEDADFATPTVAIPYVLTTQPVYTTSGGSGFQLKLDSGAAQYVFYARRGPTTNTTVRVTGRVLDR